MSFFESELRGLVAVAGLEFAGSEEHRRLRAEADAREAAYLAHRRVIEGIKAECRAAARRGERTATAVVVRHAASACRADIIYARTLFAMVNEYFEFELHVAESCIEIGQGHDDVRYRLTLSWLEPQSTESLGAA